MQLGVGHGASAAGVVDTLGERFERFERLAFAGKRRTIAARIGTRAAGRATIGPPDSVG
ncbi:unannotated protein [freshwater metagenome]|uniref:Unannotated protein n=1 Tax=freshwater metagenome TaxID=449393 RepID=A0A6J6N9X6_9ZZZZ